MSILEDGTIDYSDVRKDVAIGQVWEARWGGQSFVIVDILPGRYLRPPDVALIPCEFCLAQWLTGNGPGVLAGSLFDLRTPYHKFGGGRDYVLHEGRTKVMTDSHTTTGPPPTYIHPYGARTRPDDHEWELSDDKCVIVADAFERLHTYDSTLPTGAYIGKVWKRTDRESRWLGEYVADPDRPETHYKIVWRKIVVRIPLRAPDGKRVLPGNTDVVVPGDGAWEGYP